MHARRPTGRSDRDDGSGDGRGYGGDRLVPLARHRLLQDQRDRHAQGAEGRTKSAGPHAKRASAKTGNTGKHKTLPPIEKKSLAEQLLDEAREVELSESGIRKLPKNDSLLSRMFGKLTK